MNIRSLYISKIVGLSQFESMLEARLELEYLHSLTTKQLFHYSEELRMSDNTKPNITN